MFVWSPQCDKAVATMKSILTSEAMMKYPNHNKPFHIHTDTSNYQLGTTIIQDNQLMAYWS